MKFTIEGKLAELNTHTTSFQRYRMKSASIKCTETERVVQEARVARSQPFTSYPARNTYTWFSKDQRKDIDNVALTKSFIDDCLVDAAG